MLSDDKIPYKLLKLEEDEVLVLKNLGSQLGWAVVFYVEYLGPMVIFAMCYLLGDKASYTSLQKYPTHKS